MTVALRDNPANSIKRTRLIQWQVFQKPLFHLKCHTYRLCLLTATNTTPATITERKTQIANYLKYSSSSSTLLN